MVHWPVKLQMSVYVSFLTCLFCSGLFLLWGFPLRASSICELNRAKGMKILIIQHVSFPLILLYHLIFFQIQIPQFSHQHKVLRCSRVVPGRDRTVVQLDGVSKEIWKLKDVLSTPLFQFYLYHLNMYCYSKFDLLVVFSQHALTWFWTSLIACLAFCIF